MKRNSEEFRSQMQFSINSILQHSCTYNAVQIHKIVNYFRRLLRLVDNYGDGFSDPFEREMNNREIVTQLSVYLVLYVYDSVIKIIILSNNKAVMF